ncbi:MAG: HlyD family efflux transporter periplasmic adaptor subunit [Clostridia bacterium]|nr:HlyD family efflux transporter periplasmic adaptor subunit [Clostridia bacterium]
MQKQRSGRKKRRFLRRSLSLALLTGVILLGRSFLAPLLGGTEIETYASYTVTRGDIRTYKSFSASISVLNSETHTNTSGAESIRELYVTAGQEVKEGDKLMLLDNGELLKAGLDGVVNQMRYDTSDALWRNVQLIEISDLTHLRVSLSVDEYDVRGVAPGQPCTVSILPLGVSFETEIEHVNRVSASSGQIAYYTATAELTVPPSVLPGMSASVSIPDSAVSDVLTLDMKALAFDEDKQPYVLLKQQDAYVRQPVATGLSDGMTVEIVSGLQEGDVVWAVSGTETVDGGLTLTGLYKKLVGEKVVINNAEGSSRSNTRSGSDASRSGMSFPADGSFLRDGDAAPAEEEGTAAPGESAPGPDDTASGSRTPGRSGSGSRSSGMATGSDLPGESPTRTERSRPDGSVIPRGNEERTDPQ